MITRASCRRFARIVVARADDVVDHALQAQLCAVFRGIQAGDAVGHQLADFGGHDDAAAAAEHLDVVATVLAQQIQHVLEEFDMTALIRGNRHPLHVLLERSIDDLPHRAVMAQVDDLGPRGL